MLRVAYITNASSESGVGHQAQELQRELQKLPLEVVLFQIDGQQGKLYRQNEVMAEIRPWLGMLGAKTINWIRLGKQLQKALENERFDIIHFTNQTLSFLVTEDMPSVVTVHDLIELIDPQQLWGSWAARYLYSGLTRAKQIIAVSDYTADTIRQQYANVADRLTTIHNGVSPIFHRLDNVQKAEPPVVLYVGSDHPRKNLTTALQAFAEVKKVIPNIQFIKIGAAGIASGRQHTEAKIQKLGIQNSVTFKENLSAEELNTLYNQATVLLYPSRFEGFGLPPLQAMAAGCPVICSNATSLPEVVGDAALVRDPDDVTGFAHDLKRVLQDPALANTLRQKGLQRAQQFSWEKAAQETMAVYNKLL